MTDTVPRKGSAWWRGVVGFLLFVVVNGVVGFALELSLSILNPRASALDHIWFAALSGIMGAVAGTGALQSLLKRFPARAIAATWILLTVLLVSWDVLAGVLRPIDDRYHARSGD